MSKITHIKLDNFTSFAGLDQAFSQGVNVIIGANGTGKTHLLKVLYAACAVTVGEDKDKGFALKLRSVFNPHEGRMGRLARRQSTSVKTKAVVTREGGVKLAAEFSNHTNKPEDVKVTGEASWKKEELASAYIRSRKCWPTRQASWPRQPSGKLPLKKSMWTSSSVPSSPS
ncbi:AAA family ATPase [Parasulfuritortus cantonensis]|uniref:AAA family ATPase n=1 Tax=Parasulfuritortus cantonensis TaxID=2528202 RepID=UPI00197F238E|nr:AAA family ATPase [Parasulfuritortus cantonensis]